MDSIKLELALHVFKTSRNLLIRRIASMITTDESKKRLVISIICGVLLYGFCLSGGISTEKKFSSAGKLTKLHYVDSETKYRRLIEDAGVLMFTTNLNGDITFTSIIELSRSPAIMTKR